MARLLLLLLPLFALAAPARADEIADASRGVARIVIIAVDGSGAVAGFAHGSGFAVAGNRVVTNAHVVAAAARYPENVLIGVVPSQGNRSYPARLLAIDPHRDLALLEMQRGTLPALSLNTGPLSPGAEVVALGYPGNVDLATARSAEDYITPQTPTRSQGNYSDTREVNSVLSLLHTASIARGNSGGPLLDACGRVIGVNTFITRAEDGDATFAFAISNGEVGAFLREAKQPFRSATGGCAPGVPKQAAPPAPAAASAEAAALAEARAAIEDERQNRLAAALAFAILGVAALAYAGLLLWKDRARAALILGLTGAFLILAGTLIFLSRPPRTGLDLAPTSGVAAPL